MLGRGKFVQGMLDKEVDAEIAGLEACQNTLFILYLHP